MAWPLSQREPDLLVRPSRTFGASRSGGRRRHAGIDLYAEAGDHVVAPASGVVRIVFPWPSRAEPSGRAMILHTDDGGAVLMAPLEPDSIVARTGARVAEGEHLGVIGRYPGGSSMLHFERYAAPVRVNRRWAASDGRPPELRDPIPYLLSLTDDGGDGPPGGGGSSGGGGATGDYGDGEPTPRDPEPIPGGEPGRPTATAALWGIGLVLFIWAAMRGTP